MMIPHFQVEAAIESKEINLGVKLIGVMSGGEREAFCQHADTVRGKMCVGDVDYRVF